MNEAAGAPGHAGIRLEYRAAIIMDRTAMPRLTRAAAPAIHAGMCPSMLPLRGRMRDPMTDPAEQWSCSREIHSITAS